MVSFCANPDCAIPLRYLRHGRLFQFEVRTTTIEGSGKGAPSTPVGKIRRQLSHFWLCGRCCQNLTLVFDSQRGVEVVPLQAHNAGFERPTPTPERRLSAVAYG
jgi:hypothetical protein